MNLFIDKYANIKYYYSVSVYIPEGISLNTDIFYEYYGREKNDLESSVMPFVILQKIDSDVHVILVSDGLCRLYAADRDEVAHTLENSIYTTVHPEDAEKVSSAMVKFYDEGSLNIVFRKRRNNVFRSIYAQGSSFITDSGDKLHIIWFGDVTDIVNAEKINTYYDKMTTLPNMSAFGVLAEQERRRMRSKGTIPAFVYFDIRDMKAINEKYGFSRGNGILSGTASVLKDVFEKDAMARFSDDHFVVLTGKRHLEQKIEQVNDQVLRNPMGIPVQLCAGIYIDDKGELDIFAAIDRARIACKTIKGDYTRKYHVFDRDMFTEYRQRRHVLNHFDEALENGYIKLYYMPIVRTVTGKICDMEALARWMDPEKGILPPSQFIPVLEDNRLINKLDFYMLRKICESLAIQKQLGMPLVPVSVNLSRSNFEVCDVFDEVLSIVNEYNIAHHLLTVEITESAFIKNQQFLANQINRFREAGFNVWMDDFGSEYSSLNTLQEYSFDLIKLDMRFMKNFSLTGKNRLILSDVLTMISKLGVSTLAEGVQTKEQLRFLRDAGCDKVQGFLLGKPMPCEHFYQERIYNGLQYDDFNKTSYYDKICTIHLDPHLLMSDLGGFFGDTSITPMAVLEFSNSSFRILKANGAYKSFLEEIGQDKELIYNDYYEWYRTPAPEFIDSVKKCLSSRKNQSIVNVVENGLRISANISFIAYDAKTDTGAVLTIITKLDSPLPSDVSESTEAPKAEDAEESETEELKPADADEITSDETEADEEGSAAE